MICNGRILNVAHTLFLRAIQPSEFWKGDMTSVKYSKATHNGPIFLLLLVTEYENECNVWRMTGEEQVNALVS